MILRVDQVRDVAVTVERELPRRPLQTRLGTEDGEVDPATTDCVVGILRALATVPVTPAMHRLPVLDELGPFRQAGNDFPSELSALLTRRVGRFGDLLRSRVPDFDRRYAAVTAGLATLDRRPDTVVHGDLFAENILIDDAGQPSADSALFYGTPARATHVTLYIGDNRVIHAPYQGRAPS